MKYSILFVASLLAVCVLECGCASTGQSTRYNGGAVVNSGLPRAQVHAWRVLFGGSAADSPGDLCNGGCRLTDSQIRAALDDLRQHSGIFGPNVQFVGDLQSGGTIPIEDLVMQAGSNLPSYNHLPRQMSAVLFETLLADRIDNGDAVWDENAINVYFVGEVYPVGTYNPASTLFGVTVDPRGAVNAGVSFAGILMNDLAKNSACSYDSQITPYSADFVAGKHTLLHETTHYLARFANNTCFPIGQSGANRCYVNEHLVIQTGVDPMNIMNVSVTDTQPLYVALPGNSADTTTEKGLVFPKIRDGTYQIP